MTNQEIWNRVKKVDLDLLYVLCFALTMRLCLSCIDGSVVTDIRLFGTQVVCFACVHGASLSFSRHSLFFFWNALRRRQQWHNSCWLWDKYIREGVARWWQGDHLFLFSFHFPFSLSLFIICDPPFTGYQLCQWFTVCGWLQWWSRQPTQWVTIIGRSQQQHCELAPCFTVIVWIQCQSWLLAHGLQLQQNIILSKWISSTANPNPMHPWRFPSQMSWLITTLPQSIAQDSQVIADPQSGMFTKDRTAPLCFVLLQKTTNVDKRELTKMNTTIHSSDGLLSTRGLAPYLHGVAWIQKWYMFQCLLSFSYPPPIHNSSRSSLWCQDWANIFRTGKVTVNVHSEKELTQ